MAAEVPSHVVTEDLTGGAPSLSRPMAQQCTCLLHMAAVRAPPGPHGPCITLPCYLSLPNTGTCWRDDMWLAAFGLHHGNVLDYFVSRGTACCCC